MINKYGSHDVFTNIDIHSLCEEEADSCEGLLTEAECWNSLKGMNNNKSPGSDGLTVEFYKCFWSEIKDLVLESLNTGFCNGSCHGHKNNLFLLLCIKKVLRRALATGGLYHYSMSITKSLLVPCNID